MCFSGVANNELSPILGVSVGDIHYEYENGRKVASPLSPLMHQDSAQL